MNKWSLIQQKLKNNSHYNYENIGTDKIRIIKDKAV